MNWWRWMILLYLILINLFSCILTIYDKHRAQKGRWRVSESSLLLASALGGCPGMYITMKKIRHKTKKKKFMIGIPIIFCVQLLSWMILRFLF